MLFDSTLRRELSRSFGGTLVVILTVVLTYTLIRTLGNAASGSVSPQDIVLLLAYVSIGYLPLILTLTLFVSMVSTITRMYRDSEMAVWFCSGVALTRFVGAARGFALPVILVIAALVMLAWPWSNEQSHQLRLRYEQRSDLTRVAPGQFQSSRSGDRVFFIDKDAQAKDSVVQGGGGIFILDERRPRESVTTAKTGRIELTPDGRMLVLSRGMRTDLDTSTGTKTISSFEEYRIRIGEKALSALKEQPPNSRSTWALATDGSRAAQAELGWRMGIVLAACNFVLLGLGLASGDARRGGGWSLLSALLGFVVYFNLINLTQAWIGSGKQGLATAVLGLHGGVLALALLLLWWRTRGQAGLRLPWHLIQRRTATA